ncbi:MAG TPA: universal stress protein [Micromonosporaceae bacterium]|nr:universal stress protein [Micromonosporaceae bacterium]
MTVQPLIVVGVDGSWRRTGALEWALHEALLRRTPLRAVHVVDQHAQSYGPVDIDGQRYRPVPVDDEATMLMDEVARHVRAVDPALDLDADIVAGPPGRKLAEIGADARMLVVGRRGLGTFTRLLIGSTSEAAANHAQGPVVVVPDDWQPQRHRGEPIVVGVDGTSPSEAALEFAFEAATAHDVPLWMVHVWDVPPAAAWDTAAISDVHDRWKAIAERTLDQVAEQWHRKYPDVDLRQKARQSHPVLGLLDAATATDAQLLIVGGRRQNRMTGLLLGSVARGVLHHATWPVAVVHERRGAQRLES